MNSPASTQVDTNNISLANGTLLFAELDSVLDSKKMKAGDQVFAHLTEAVKSDGKVLLPKGARILGHVTQSSARAKGDSASVIAVQFDTVIPKKGEESSVRLAIQALSAAHQNTFADGAPGQDPMAGRGASATTSPMGLGRPVSGAGGSAGEPDGAANNDGQLTASSRGVFGLSDIRLASKASDASDATQGSVLTSTGKNVHLDSGTRLLLISQAAPNP